MTSPAPPEGLPAGLVDRLASQIRGKILSGAIPVGAQLRQADLAAEFGVSRTPVREALRQLQAGGLLDVVPNRGAVVRIPTPWEVRHAYEVRAELEGMAAAKAVERVGRRELAILKTANDVLRKQLTSTTDDAEARRTANDTFHTTLLELSGNPWLVSITERINESFPRHVSSVSLAGDDRQREENIEQHDQIIDALSRRDARAARRRMSRHILSSGEYLTWWYEHIAAERAAR
jgi:DNA-binding GntR family transcriptional regulator